MMHGANCDCKSCRKGMRNPLLEEEAEWARSLQTPVEPDQFAATEHTRSCPALNPGDIDADCTCGLQWRIDLQTEREMHNAWRKRAEEAELELTAARDRERVYRELITKLDGIAQTYRCDWGTDKLVHISESDWGDVKKALAEVAERG